MSSNQAFTIRMLFPDGSPEGLRIVEKPNWTGKCVMAPRNRFAELRKREEFNRVGVYMLIGPPTDGLPEIYVGEGDLISDRLISHYRTKEFWLKVVFFVSAGSTLNKAHVQYLEARLVKRAREAKRCLLKNENQPQAPSLSEIDAAEMDEFMTHLLGTLAVLGIDVFEKPAEASGATSILNLGAKGLKAAGYESDAGFVVKSGSQSPIQEVPTVPIGVKRLRDELRHEGVFRESGDHLLLTQDYEFSSPSLAAAVLLGRSANGRVEWKDAKGRTLKELQEAELREELS